MTVLSSFTSEKVKVSECDSQSSATLTHLVFPFYSDISAYYFEEINAKMPTNLQLELSLNHKELWK